MSARQCLSLVLILLLASSGSSAAVRGDKVMYVGGTVDIPENTKGKFDLSDSTNATLLSEKGKILLTIPYEKVTGLEYGQKAGRRLGLSIAVSPLFLFSKKRKHYFTIYFTDDAGNTQAAVLELAKGVVGEVVNTMQARTGQTVDFESDEARKHFEKEAGGK